MSAETSQLTKVDSAVEPGSPNDKKAAHRRTSSSNPDVHNIADLEKQGVELQIAPETQKLGWKLNTSPMSLGEPDTLKKPLCMPMVKKVDLHFPLGLEVTARNLKGVTIKDALDAIHKQFKKKADDELDSPYLAGFEWDKEECYTRFIVHQSKQPNLGGGSGGSSKKSKKKGGDATNE